MVMIPGSISNDLAMPVIPLGMTFHDVQPIPVGPPIPCAPCVEPPVMMMWPPGVALFQTKLTTFLQDRKEPLLVKIRAEKAFSDALGAELKAAVLEFKQTYR